MLDDIAYPKDKPPKSIMLNYLLSQGGVNFLFDIPPDVDTDQLKKIADIFNDFCEKREVSAHMRIYGDDGVPDDYRDMCKAVASYNDGAEIG